MKDTIVKDFPLAERTVHGSTHLRVTVDYTKHNRLERRGIYMRVYPVEVKPNGITTLVLSLLGRNYLFLEQLDRANATKLNRHKAEVARQLEGRSGPCWDQVLYTCETEKLKLAEPEPAAG